MLQGAELNYPKMKKLVLALIHAARRLQWVSRWAIDLGEHEIEFKPRNEVKEQILADFLAETQEGEDDKEKEPSEKEKGSIWKSVTRSFTHMERQSKMAQEGTNTC
ncbi:hypothetical protein Tco_1157492 [Tanacetum coccineum]